MLIQFILNMNKSLHLLGINIYKCTYVMVFGNYPQHMADLFVPITVLYTNGPCDVFWHLRQTIVFNMVNTTIFDMVFNMPWNINTFFNTHFNFQNASSTWWSIKDMNWKLREFQITIWNYNPKRLSGTRCIWSLPTQDRVVTAVYTIPRTIVIYEFEERPREIKTSIMKYSIMKYSFKK